MAPQEIHVLCPSHKGKATCRCEVVLGAFRVLSQTRGEDSGVGSVHKQKADYGLWCYRGGE